MLSQNRIDNLKKFDGFSDLIEYFETQAETHLMNARRASEDDKKLKYLAKYENLMEVIDYLKREPLDNSNS
jgi:negative regulator of genetic competence, sporulation and motility